MRQAVENSWKNFAKNFQKFLPAPAVAVVPCGARVSVGNAACPWKGNSRGFAPPGLFVLPREGLPIPSCCPSRSTRPVARFSLTWRWGRNKLFPGR